MDFQTQPTPNPNSLKIVRADGGPMLASGMVSATSFAEAATHPLAAALFAVDGVTGVFALPDFVTVTKRPDAVWNALLPGVEAALRDAL